jgi:hypothetical protein
VIEFGIVVFAFGEYVPNSGKDFTGDSNGSLFTSAPLFERDMLVFEFRVLI